MILSMILLQTRTTVTLAVSPELALLQLVPHFVRAQKLAAAALLPFTFLNLFMTLFETYVVSLLQVK